MTQQVFITEEEYKADIYDLFKHFAFKSSSQELLDITVLKMLFAALGKPLSPEQAKTFWVKTIKNGLSGITYPEFESFYLSIFPYDSSALLKEAFDVFDHTHSGKISFSDMKAVVSTIHGSFTDDDLNQFIEVFDKSDDKTISFEEVQKSFC